MELRVFTVVRALHVLATGGGRLGLRGGQVDNQAVELLFQHNLASEAAAVAWLGDTHVDQVRLYAARGADGVPEFFAHPYVASSAGVVPTTLADDAGHTIAESGRHDRVAALAVNNSCFACSTDIRNLNHPNLLLMV
jgi:hypothetical protein